MDPQMNPKMDPANFRGPSVKKGSPGSLQGPHWSIFYIDFQTTDKLEFTAWGESEIRFQRKLLVCIWVIFNEGVTSNSKSSI